MRRLGNALLALIVLFGVGCKKDEAVYEGRPVSYWVARLELEYAGHRRQAATALGEIGPAAEVAIPALVRRLQDDESTVRIEAARALGNIGRRPQTVVPALAALLDNENCSVRGIAAGALGEFGREARSVVPALFASLERTDRLCFERGLARPAAAQLTAHSLIEIGRETPEVAATLFQFLKEERRPYLGYAEDILVGIGPNAIPPAIEALQDYPHREERGDAPFIATRALKRIGSPAVYEIIPLLGHKDIMIRHEAEYLLAKIGVPAVGPLVKALAWGSKDVRLYSASALEKIGSARAVPALRRALRDPEEEVRTAAAATLEKIRSNPEQVLSDEARARARLHEVLDDWRKTVDSRDLIGGTALMQEAWGLVPPEVSSKELASLMAELPRRTMTFKEAVQYGDLVQIEAHLKRSGINADLGLGWTPLHMAAFYGQSEATRLLLRRGADVNAAAEDGHTPLHAAAAWASPEVAQLLLSSGSNVNARDNKGRTPLHWAVSGRQDKAVLLLQEGAEVDAADQQGRTALHLAAMHGFTEVAASLLAAGADTQIRDADGHTPLDLASLLPETTSRKRAIGLLLARDADPGT